MTSTAVQGLPRWSLAVPPFALVVLVLSWGGLTIPAIAIASIWLDGPLVLGLGGKEMVLFALTVVVSMLTLATGRATLLQGAVHLMVFSSFLFLAVSP